MYYVYVLQSQVDRRLYVGYSADLKNRLARHNLNKVKSTKAYTPWTLIYYEAYKGHLDATKREKHLKMHAAKKDLINRLKYSIQNDRVAKW